MFFNKNLSLTAMVFFFKYIFVLIFVLQCSDSQSTCPMTCKPPSCTTGNCARGTRDNTYIIHGSTNIIGSVSMVSSNEFYIDRNTHLTVANEAHLDFLNSNTFWTADGQRLNVQFHERSRFNARKKNHVFIEHRNPLSADTMTVSFGEKSETKLNVLVNLLIVGPGPFRLGPSSTFILGDSSRFFVGGTPGSFVTGQNTKVTVGRSSSAHIAGSFTGSKGASITLGDHSVLNIGEKRTIVMTENSSLILEYQSTVDFQSGNIGEFKFQKGKIQLKIEEQGRLWIRDGLFCLLVQSVVVKRQTTLRINGRSDSTPGIRCFDTGPEMEG